MAKIKTIVISLILITGIAMTQTFLFNPGQTQSSIELGAIVAFSGTIQNISEDSLSLVVVRTDLFLPPYWNSQLCLGSICFPPDYDSLATTSSGAPFYQEPIPPDSTIYFALWFTAFDTTLVEDGTATATMKLYDLNNPDYILFQDYMASTDNFILVSILNDWNLVGLPLSVEDTGYSTIFPDAIPGTLYEFSGTYIQTQELIEGKGYWLRFNDSDNTAIFGESISDLTIALNADWNLISGISDTLDLSQFDDPEDIIIPGTLFGFNGTYEQVSSLIPGKGYWIRTIDSGEVSISTDSERMMINNFNDRSKIANVLNFNGQKLYFGISIPQSEKLSYTLPPKPPVGAFDARFEGDRSVIKDRGIIEIMNPRDSLTMSFDLSKIEGKWILKNPETGYNYLLVGEGQINIEGNIEQLILKKVHDRSNPESLQVVKVFPNPFNSVVNISFSLPNSENSEQFVSIKIYDLTGKMVKELFNGMMKKGDHKIQWDGTNNFDTHVSAGVHLLIVNTNKFNHTEKLLILK